MKRRNGDARQAFSLDGFFALLRNKERRWAATGMASAMGTLALAAIKALVGVYAASAFLAFNALFSVTAAISKIIIVRGDGAHRRSAGIVLSAGCIPLALYCTGMVFAGWGSNARYDNIAGITVAAGAFADFGLAISGIVSACKMDRGHFMALKQVNLACALVMIQLTQVALLSFADETTCASELANGAMGLACTLAALGLGVNVTIKGAKHPRRKERRQRTCLEKTAEGSGNESGNLPW